MLAIWLEAFPGMARSVGAPSTRKRRVANWNRSPSLLLIGQILEREKQGRGAVGQDTRRGSVGRNT
jgi:hypothetical protein